MTDKTRRWDSSPEQDQRVVKNLALELEIQTKIGDLRAETTEAESERTLSLSSAAWSLHPASRYQIELWALELVNILRSIISWRCKEGMLVDFIHLTLLNWHTSVTQFQEKNVWHRHVRDVATDWFPWSGLLHPGKKKQYFLSSNILANRSES